MDQPARASLLFRPTACLALLLLAALLGAGAQASVTEIKVATVAPDGSHWLQEMRAGAARIKARTDGRVEMRFYPGGVMGNDTQVLRRLRAGQLQGGAFTSGGLGERYRALNLYGIPLLFRSLEEVDYVRERLDPVLAEGLESAGFVTFGFVEGGFAELMSNQPVRSVEDLRRRKVWVPEGDQISFAAMEAMGLSPVVLPVTDVLTGLQTGLLDVIAASPVVALVMQWHTRTKYITDLPVSYSMGVFAIDARTFQRLSPGDQAVVREEMTAVMSGLDKDARADNRRAREVLERTGLEYVAVNQADVAGWRETIEGTFPRLRRRPDIDAEILDRLLGLLAEHRGAREGLTRTGR
jgi:TRAP-type transport system periplasmic protein